MSTKQSRSSSPKKIVSAKTKSNKSNKSNKSTIKRGKSFKSLNARITRKSQRKFNVERVGKILDILPQFAKFYSKLTPDEIMAVKFYKGYGSFFQSKLLADYKTASDKKAKKGKKGEKKQRELSFPFNIFQENSFRQDIFQYGNDLLPFTKSFDIKELPKYIETSYKARITLLNRLDTIYDKPDCPKMTGEEILFRGMGETPDTKNLKVGDTYMFKNFISTTIDRKIAENFSEGQSLFVLMNMKDIPFIYMPNNKMYTKNFTQFMMNQDPLWDFSEYTLPRNLEFKIEKIDKKPVQSEWGGNNISFTKLQQILKKQGYFKTATDTTTTTTPTTDSTTPILPDTNTVINLPVTNPQVNKQTLIEQNIYPMATVYYCTLHNWHPRRPISYEEITKDAKFVLDKNALDSWSKELPRWF